MELLNVKENNERASQSRFNSLDNLKRDSTLIAMLYRVSRMVMKYSKSLNALKRDSPRVPMLHRVSSAFKVISCKFSSSQCISESIISSHLNTCSFDVNKSIHIDLI